MHANMADDCLWRLDGVSLEPARLREVTLVVPRGVTAVLGWSGAGKSSLLNLLVGFERLDRGSLVGKPRCGWAPQDGGLWPQLTTREHLEIARRSSDGIDALLASFDLLEKAVTRPDALSQGEQSRLAVARALAADAEVLVMDEPLVHVDPVRRGKYWNVIREYLGRTGASLLFATHEPEAVLSEAQRVICLRGGRVLHEGAVVELYAHPPNAELMDFLGPGNWFEPEEANAWFGEKFCAPGCVRPEQLVIEPTPDGMFEVEAARFQGTVAEVLLRANGSSTARQFFHRPPHAGLRPGQRVRLRTLTE
jgi:ABC-type Fe3+/spermidine/putrescine transport system ATPase subunit